MITLANDIVRKKVIVEIYHFGEITKILRRKFIRREKMSCTKRRFFSKYFSVLKL